MWCSTAIYVNFTHHLCSHRALPNPLDTWGGAGGTPWRTGPRFNIRWYVLSEDLVKSRSREIGSSSYGIALQFDRHFGSPAAELPAKFQSDRTILNTNLAASKLCEFLQTFYRILKRGPGAAPAESCTHPAKRDHCFPPPIAQRQRLPNVGIGIIGTNFREIPIKIQTFSSMKLHSKCHLWNGSRFVHGGRHKYKALNWKAASATTGVTCQWQCVASYITWQCHQNTSYSLCRYPPTIFNCVITICQCIINSVIINSVHFSRLAIITSSLI